MKFLQGLSAFLSKWTPVVVTLAAVFSYFLPEAFGWTLWNKGIVQTCLLGLIMLTMGLTLTREDFRILAARPFDILIGSIAQYTLMPLLAYGVVHGLGLPKAVGVGLILVGCCPGGVSSNIMTFLCKGDVAFSVGMTTLSTLVAPVMTPLLMLWLAGESVDVDAVGMFTSILFVTILPVAVGFVLNAMFGQRPGFGEAKKLLPGVAVLGLACIVGGVVSAHGQKFAQSGVLIFVGVFLHNTLGYVLGYVVGIVARFTRAKRRTISIEVGMQNAGLATVLAGKHFPLMPEAAVASAVSCAWHSISGALLAGIFNWADDIADRLKRKVLKGDASRKRTER
jgi:BASS family bile acid:Na+ symporter